MADSTTHASPSKQALTAPASPASPAPTTGGAAMVPATGAAAVATPVRRFPFLCKETRSLLIGAAIAAAFVFVLSSLIVGVRRRLGIPDGDKCDAPKPATVAGPAGPTAAGGVPKPAPTPTNPSATAKPAHKQPWMTASPYIVDATTDDVAAAWVSGANGPAIVVVYSPNCPACHAYMPTVEAAAARMHEQAAAAGGKAPATWVRVDWVAMHMGRWQRTPKVTPPIRSYPSTLLVRGGGVAPEMRVGAAPLPKLMEWVQTTLTSPAAPSTPAPAPAAPAPAPAPAAPAAAAPVAVLRDEERVPVDAPAAPPAAPLDAPAQLVQPWSAPGAATGAPAADATAAAAPPSQA